ncbi:hypothetical protein FRB99_002245, partial [Tulasnella sp. 403]
MNSIFLPILALVMNLPFQMPSHPFNGLGFCLLIVFVLVTTATTVEVIALLQPPRPGSFVACDVTPLKPGECMTNAKYFAAGLPPLPPTNSAIGPEGVTAVTAEHEFVVWNVDLPSGILTATRYNSDDPSSAVQLPTYYWSDQQQSLFAAFEDSTLHIL